MSEWLHTDWYRQERSEIDDTPRTGLLLAGQVYGAHYLDMFDDYCISSMLAPANCEALVENNALVEMYTNAESFDMLEAHMQRLKDVGIDTSIRLIPDELFQPGYTWLLLGATHTLSGQRAARTGMDFHMLMPDQTYSENFFPNLFRLGAQHGGITQTALNMDGAGMAALQKYFQADGSLAAPAVALADIAWEYLHERMAVQIANNAMIHADYLPNTHYHLWRAADRVLLFSACSNPIFVPSELCKRFESDDPTTSTLDIWPQALFDADFHSPSPEDDMAVIGIEPGGAWAGPQKTLFDPSDADAFAANFWSWIGNRDDHLVYYEKPVLNLETSKYPAPTVEEIMERQQEFVHLLKMKKREA